MEKNLELEDYSNVSVVESRGCFGPVVNLLRQVSFIGVPRLFNAMVTTCVVALSQQLCGGKSSSAKLHLWIQSGYMPLLMCILRSLVNIIAFYSGSNTDTHA